MSVKVTVLALAAAWLACGVGAAGVGNFAVRQDLCPLVPLAEGDPQLLGEVAGATRRVWWQNLAVVPTGPAGVVAGWAYRGRLAPGWSARGDLPSSGECGK